MVSLSRCVSLSWVRTATIRRSLRCWAVAGSGRRGAAAGLCRLLSRVMHYVFQRCWTDGKPLLKENKSTSQRLSCRIPTRAHWNYRDGLLRRASRIGFQRDQSERHDGSDRYARTVSITAEAAHLPGLSLRRCLLTDPSKPALHVNELRTEAGMSFAGSTIRACTAEGAIRLNGAHIGGQLDCSGATITNPSGPALHGEHLPEPQGHRETARSAVTTLEAGSSTPEISTCRGSTLSNLPRGDERTPVGLTSSL